MKPKTNSTSNIVQWSMFSVRARCYWIHCIERILNLCLCLLTELWNNAHEMCDKNSRSLSRKRVKCWHVRLFFFDVIRTFRSEIFCFRDKNMLKANEFSAILLKTILRKMCAILIDEIRANGKILVAKCSV